MFILFFKSRHLLSFLVGLELVGLVILLLFFVGLVGRYREDVWLAVYFICFLAVESALGLVLFVLIIRRFSKDYFLFMGLLKF